MMQCARAAPSMWVLLSVHMHNPAPDMRGGVHACVSVRVCGGGGGVRQSGSGACLLQASG